MRGYLEAQKRLLLDQVSDKDPETERTLKQAFDAALDSAFEDMEENGVQPDSEERFWKRLSQMLSDCGCLRHGYMYFENVADKAYLVLENYFRCWPPQEDPDWPDNASYVLVQRWDERNRHKYFTLLLPAEPEALRAYLQENGISNPRECRIVNVHMKEPVFRELEMALPGCGDLMEANYLFYRLGKLSETEKQFFAYGMEMGKYITAKELINLSANLDGIYFQGGIGSKAELGKFLVLNDLCFYQFNDEALPFLDYEKIAEKHMEETGGRLCRGMYIERSVTSEEWVEIYDGVHLPGFTLAQEENQETQEINGGMAL